MPVPKVLKDDVGSTLHADPASINISCDAAMSDRPVRINSYDTTDDIAVGDIPATRGTVKKGGEQVKEITV